MGLALVAAGDLPGFDVPLWVVALSATAMGLGTYAGGWRIMRTLGWRIFRIEPATGMAAQVLGASVIQVATQLGLPVSTTHCMTGSAMGSGFGRRPRSLSLTMVTNIVASWVITIPAAASLAWVAYAILHTAGLGA